MAEAPVQVNGRCQAKGGTKSYTGRAPYRKEAQGTVRTGATAGRPALRAKLSRGRSAATPVLCSQVTRKARPEPDLAPRIPPRRWSASELGGSRDADIRVALTQTGWCRGVAMDPSVACSAAPGNRFAGSQSVGRKARAGHVSFVLQ
jgi:hypothetical protein